MKKIILLFVILFSFCLSSLFAQIDSQWRGDARDGKYNNEKLLKSWPGNGPSLVTTLKGIGKGYSSPAVTENRIYITGMEEGNGYLFAFDLSGKLLWKKKYGKEWDTSYPGARVSPTISNDKIYFSSSLGQIFCFDISGKNIWGLDMLKEFDAPNLRWGMVESLLVDGDNLFCTPGSENVSIAVLNKHTGKVIKKIKGNGQETSYCSPNIINHNGRRILVTMLAKSLIGIDLKSMKIIFEHEHITDYNINPNTPLYNNGYIYIVSGYGTGGQLLKLSNDGNKLTQIWEDEELDSQMGATVLVDGPLYGSGHDNRDWHCVDFLTGKVKYSSRELGRKGNIIFADGMIYIYSEKGDIGLVKPNIEKFDVVSSFKLRDGSGQHWAHPVIKNGKLYVRHGNILNIYNIAR